MMTLNREKIYHASEPKGLMFNWKLHCLWRYFTKQTGGRQDV